MSNQKTKIDESWEIFEKRNEKHLGNLMTEFRLFNDLISWIFLRSTSRVLKCIFCYQSAPVNLCLYRLHVLRMTILWLVEWIAS